MRGLLQLLAGITFIGVPLACSSSSGAAPNTSAVPKVNPDFITTSEIDAQSFRDAYDLVQRLRPTWFTRKSGSSTARRMGVSTSSSAIGAGLVVYLDNSRLGGVDALRQLTTSAIESLQFMDAATATATLPGLGSSVISGAIVARTRRGF